MTTYYRIQAPTYTPEDLLNPENWNSWDYNETVREGVSVCGSLEELATYFAQVGIEWDDTFNLIELEGDFTGEDALDADMGEYLIYPTKIVSVEPITDRFMDMIFEAYDQIAA